jgi:atypical dual specificity phosphatase
LESGDILRKIYDIFLHRPMNFSFIDDYVCGSARFMSKRSIDWVRGKGVRAILSLTETPIPKAWLDSSIDYLQVPIENHHAPTLAQLKTCVAFISKNVAKGNKTDVHCAAGKGRTGTILAAYVSTKNNISAELAIEQIRAKRKGSVERDPRAGQEAAVSEYRKGFSKTNNAQNG